MIKGSENDLKSCQNLLETEEANDFLGTINSVNKITKTDSGKNSDNIKRWRKWKTIYINFHNKHVIFFT